MGEYKNTLRQLLTKNSKLLNRNLMYRYTKFCVVRNEVHFSVPLRYEAVRLDEQDQTVILWPTRDETELKRWHR
jgi:hypothetical protein